MIIRSRLSIKKNVAVRDFAKLDNLPQYLDDQSRSVLLSAVVLFGAGCVEFDGLARNREAVLTWAKNAFGAILVSTPFVIGTPFA